MAIAAEKYRNMTDIVLPAKNIITVVVGSLAEMKGVIAIVKKDISVMTIVRTYVMVMITATNKEDLIKVS